MADRDETPKTVTMPAWAWELISNAAHDVAEGATIYDAEDREELDEALSAAAASIYSAPSKRSFTVRVSQLVEQIGFFEVEADSFDQALKLATDGRDLFQITTWTGEGDGALRANVYSIEDADGGVMAVDGNALVEVS